MTTTVYSSHSRRNAHDSYCMGCDEQQSIANKMDVDGETVSLPFSRCQADANQQHWQKSKNRREDISKTWLEVIIGLFVDSGNAGSGRVTWPAFLQQCNAFVKWHAVRDSCSATETHRLAWFVLYALPVADET